MFGLLIRELASSEFYYVIKLVEISVFLTWLPQRKKYAKQTFSGGNFDLTEKIEEYMRFCEANLQTLLGMPRGIRSVGGDLVGHKHCQRDQKNVNRDFKYKPGWQH